MPAQRLYKSLEIGVLLGEETELQLNYISRRGYDLDARDRDGNTALMLAAMHNEANICRILLDAGANPDLVDPPVEMP